MKYLALDTDCHVTEYPLYSLSKLLETGQINRMWLKYKTRYNPNCGGNEAEPLGINNTATAFLFMSAALVLTFFLVLAEVTWSWWNNDETGKTQRTRRTRQRTQEKSLVHEETYLLTKSGKSQLSLFYN